MTPGATHHRVPCARRGIGACLLALGVLLGTAPLLLAADAAPADAWRSADVEERDSVLATVDAPEAGEGIPSPATLPVTGDVSPVALFWEQPPPVTEPLVTPPTNFRPRRYRINRGYLTSGDTPLARLASAPNMFGDLNSMAGQIEVDRPGEALRIDIPLAGGTRRLKVAENNKPIPMDRVFYNYSHFTDAVVVHPDLLTPGPTLGNPIDRHIVGVEKTFFAGWSSLEVRMPLTGGVDVNAAGFSMRADGVGNLVLSGKQLLAVGEGWAWAAGLGIELPTGSDVAGTISSTDFLIQNRATHLFPYVGFLTLPNEYCFLQGYLQFDFATGGNPIRYTGVVPSPDLALREQHMLHADLAGGCWLYSDLDAPLLTGVAALIELHYAGTIQDAQLATAGLGPNVAVSMGNHYNAVDILNLTAGLHFELAGRTTVRIGGAVPLRDQPDRFFSSEFQFSINRFY